jgi:glycosyltransferase involved in cell wall biosynthesis
MRAIWLTNWFDNPYKQRLVAELANVGVEVDMQHYQLWFLFQVLRSGRPKILHFHVLTPYLIARNRVNRSLKALLLILQVLLLRWLGVKTVWTVHEWQDKESNDRYQLSLRLAAIALLPFHGVIVHCESTKQALISTVGASLTRKIQVIPHGHYIGCYPNTLTPAVARDKLGIPQSQFCFLLFGWIYRYKGVLQAIDAFEQLNDPQTTLIIAGGLNDPELGRTIEQKIEHNHRVLFLPERVPDDQIQLYLNACDCVLLPYQVFTTSGVALLAMSFGKPCIAPATGFFTDVFDETRAFLYDQDRLQPAMQAAIEARSQIAAMGDRNLAVAQQWSWDYVAAETLKVYSA